MSAYIVSDKTIEVIVEGIMYFDKIKDRELLKAYPEEIKELGQWLVDANYESVNYRYNDDTPPHEFEIQEVEWDWGTLVGCIDCYEYQACETENYYTSDVHEKLTDLESYILKEVLRDRGYNIPWGI